MSVQKEGKDLTKPNSYRPISLLGKLMDCITNKRTLLNTTTSRKHRSTGEKNKIPVYNPANRGCLLRVKSHKGLIQKKHLIKYGGRAESKTVKNVGVWENVQVDEALP